LSVVVPSVLFGVPAGAYVDRWDKRKVLIVTNLARGVVLLGYILFVLQLQQQAGNATPVTLALLYIVSFLFSVISQFFAPAETAMIPTVVGRAKLMQANSLFYLTFTASQLLGLVFFGPLIVKVLGEITFFGLMAVLYMLCGLLVWGLPSEVVSATEDRETHPVGELFSQVREVVRLLIDDPQMLWAMGYLTLGGTLALVLAMLAPRYVVTELGIAAADAVFVMAPGGIGALGAAFLFSHGRALAPDHHRSTLRGLTIVSVALAVVAALPSVGRIVGVLRPQGDPVYIVSHWEVITVAGVMIAALLAGFGFAAIVASSQTLLQERAPVRARGRVFAVQLMLGNLCAVIPLLLIGGLADLMGVNRVLMLVAIAVMAFAFLGRQRWEPMERPLVPGNDPG
jgi:MFS family permease